jgi:hypothetical protein
MARTVFALMLGTLATPTLALDEPVVWRDPDTSCAYWLTPGGGITPRLRRDGSPDCPDAGNTSSPPRVGSPLIRDETARELAQGVERGLDALKREVERLGDRLNRR